MMHTLTPRVIPLLALAALAALGFAYTAEYGFGLKPCVLCLYQRIPYAIMVALGIVYTALNKPALRTPILLLLILAAFTDAGIAAFHVGVEQKWWHGTEGCGGAGLKGSMEALRAAILAAPVVRCDEPAAVFLGLSMTAWNLLYALGLALFGLYALKRP